MALATWLTERDVSRVDVVGIATDHCVRATALDAPTRGLRDDGAARPHGRGGARTTDAALAELTEAGVRLLGAPTVEG